MLWALRWPFTELAGVPPSGNSFQGRNNTAGAVAETIPGFAGWAFGLSGRFAGSRFGIDWSCLQDRCRTLQRSPKHT